jgi:hypothetical protein
MNDTIQPAGPSKGLVERAKAMILSPKSEWPVVAAEADSVQSVFVKYVVPLAAIGPIASLIGGQVFGYGALGFSYRLSLMSSLTTTITQYVLTLLGVFLVAWIANFLSPKFGGKNSFASAFKWCAYAFTAGWVAAVLGIIPALGIIALLASLYSLYVLYLGATPVMAVPQDKAAGYTAVTVIATIVVYIVVATVAGSLTASLNPINAATIASLDGSADQVEVNVPGYGQVKVTDNGDRQTVEIPGMGKVEAKRDGDTVTIEGEGFKAEVRDTTKTAAE